MVWQVPSDDEWDLALGQLILSELVRVGFSRRRYCHVGCILAQLKGASSQDPCTLILGEEIRGDSLGIFLVATFVLETICSETILSVE